MSGFNYSDSTAVARPCPILQAGYKLGEKLVNIFKNWIV